MPSDALLARIRGEYREMPGLRLTVAQTCRLWQLDAPTCAAVVEGLVAQGFIIRTRDGAFVALPPTPKAVKVEQMFARVGAWRDGRLSARVMLADPTPRAPHQRQPQLRPDVHPNAQQLPTSGCSCSEEAAQ